VVTKVVAGWGAGRNGGDKLLIGLGMMPRGEVGLIFATIGMGVGVFGDDLYAALVLVVLATTVISPAALRWRINSKGPVEVDLDIDAEPEPEGGWLAIESGRITLAANPPTSATPNVLLSAALLARDNKPSDGLLDWIAERRNRDLVWDRDATTKLLEVLRNGTPRSWRLLEVAGLFERTVPEIAEAIRERASDVSELDPTNALRFPTVETLRDATAVASSQSDTLLLAAFLADVGSPTRNDDIDSPAARHRSSPLPARSKIFSTVRAFCAPRSNTSRTVSTTRCFATSPTVCGDPASSNAVGFSLTQLAASNRGSTPR